MPHTNIQTQGTFLQALRMNPMPFLPPIATTSNQLSIMMMTTTQAPQHQLIPPPHTPPPHRTKPPPAPPTTTTMAATRRDVACVVLLLLVAVANAFVRQPALSSPRQQQQLQRSSSSAQQHQRTGVRSLMAKGGAEMGRKQAKRELMERQRAMAEFNAEIETTPVFQVFAATQKMKGLWMPIAAFKADNVAKGVVDASLQEGIAANFFKGVYKAQVETAVSKAIYDNEKRLREQGQAMHAPLKGCPANQIIWGFKILYKPLQDKVSGRTGRKEGGREGWSGLADGASRKPRFVHGLTHFYFSYSFFQIRLSINTGGQDAAAQGRDQGHGQELV